MKKIMFIVLLLMVVMSLGVLAQSARIAESADIQVSLLNQEPDPTEPGRYVDVRFKIENNGGDVAKDFFLEILPEYPFYLDPGKSAIEKIASVHSQTGSEAFIVKYRLRVDEKALEGDEELKIRYKFNNGGWIEPDPFVISVRTQDAIISVDSVSSSNEVLSPGTSSAIKIKITNTADSVLKDIKAVLSLGDNFVPMGSTNEKSVYQLGSKQSYEFSFNVLVKPQTASGVYQIPLSINYADELGNRYTKNGSIGVIVGSKPDLSITIDETTVYEGGNKGEITIKVVNKGVTDVKFMSLSMVPSGGVKVLSNRQAYLGNIDSDDFETADFSVYVDDTGNNQIAIPLVLQYKDANNKDYKENVELTLDLFTSKEAKKLGLKESGGSGVWIAVILVLVVGFFLYRRYRRKSK